jgi:hypothetical protein
LILDALLPKSLRFPEEAVYQAATKKMGHRLYLRKHVFLNWKTRLFWTIVLASEAYFTDFVT